MITALLFSIAQPIFASASAPPPAPPVTQPRVTWISSSAPDSRREASLSWSCPTTGTLKGFTIVIQEKGPLGWEYHSRILVCDPSLRLHVEPLPPGTYRFLIRAVTSWSSELPLPALPFPGD